MREVGYAGVILEYGPGQLDDESTLQSEQQTESQIEAWRAGMLHTVRMAEKGDFVGFKYVVPSFSRVNLFKARLSDSAFNCVEARK